MKPRKYNNKFCRSCEHCHVRTELFYSDLQKKEMTKEYLKCMLTLTDMDEDCAIIQCNMYSKKVKLKC